MKTDQNKSLIWSWWILNFCLKTFLWDVDWKVSFLKEMSLIFCTFSSNAVVQVRPIKETRRLCEILYRKLSLNKDTRHVQTSTSENLKSYSIRVWLHGGFGSHLTLKCAATLPSGGESVTPILKWEVCLCWNYEKYHWTPEISSYLISGQNKQFNHQQNTTSALVSGGMCCFVFCR